MAVFVEKRRDRRIPVTERGVLINRDDQNEVIPVMITDVSYKGVGVLSEKLFSAAGRYTLKYALLHRQFSWPVRIRWTKSNPDGCYAGCLKEDVNEAA
jgi:hypothetical protein